MLAAIEWVPSDQYRDECKFCQRQLREIPPRYEAILRSTTTSAAVRQDLSVVVAQKPKAVHGTLRPEYSGALATATLERGVQAGEIALLDAATAAAKRCGLSC